MSDSASPEFSKLTRAAGVLDGIGSAVTLAESKLAHSVQAADIASKLASAYDTDRYKAVQSIGLTATKALGVLDGIDQAAKLASAYDTDRYKAVQSIGLTATHIVPGGLTAHSHAWVGGPGETAPVPTHVHDGDLAPAGDNEFDHADRLVVLLACLVSLIVLLLAAQILDAREAIPQTRLWVAVFGDRMLHSPEFYGWMGLSTLVIWLMTLRRRR